jgi:hypothetical protein
MMVLMATLFPDPGPNQRWALCRYRYRRRAEMSHQRHLSFDLFA